MQSFTEMTNIHKLSEILFFVFQILGIVIYATVAVGARLVRKVQAQIIRNIFLFFRIFGLLFMIRSPSAHTSHCILIIPPDGFELQSSLLCERVQRIVTEG